VRGTVTSKCMRRHKKADKRCSSRCLRWYYVLYPPPGHEGPRKRQWSQGFATKREAEQALTQELARRDQGIILSGEKITVRQFAQRWLDHMAMLGRDERTLERYRDLLELHALPTIGGLQVRALQPHQLSALYASLLTHGRRDGKPGGLKPRTVGHVHRALHRMLRQAVRWRLLALNPASDLELPAAVNEPMVTLTHQQARTLLAAARPRRWLYVLILLGVATGARLGELLALRWSDVDLERGTVRIGRSRWVVNGRMQVKGPKTEAGYRTVMLGVATIAQLRRLRAEQVRQRLALGRHYSTAEALVICKPDGRPYRPDSASTMFRVFVDRLGLPKTVHVHTLRHSAASFLAAAGVPTSDIAAQLGHADGGALALRVYVHPLAEGLARAGAQLDRVVGEQR
jgi:integrase